jgi:tetratricopeptide (TPR) repeat protein
LDVQAELHHKATEIYQANGNYPKSLRHAERALEIRRVLFGDKNVEVAKDKYYLGAVYLKFLKINQSLKLHEEAAATFREIAPDNANLPFLLEDLGGIYRGHWQAKLILEELLAFFRENLPPNHGQTLEHKKLLEKIEKAGSADSLSAAVQAKR